MREIFISRIAYRDIEGIYDYLLAFDAKAAEAHINRLEAAIESLRDESPVWAYFHVTGAPYRARLFAIGKRTSFWIVYRVFEEVGLVRIYRIWSASRNPGAFSP